MLNAFAEMEKLKQEKNVILEEFLILAAKTVYSLPALATMETLALLEIFATEMETARLTISAHHRANARTLLAIL